MLYEDRYRILGILLSSLIFYFPILYAGVFFADDIYRVNVESGGFIWEEQGRFLATLISYIYGGATNIVIDAFPLTWFINIVLFSLSVYLLYKKFSEQDKEIAIYISLLFIINPFFTYNLYYRFDSIGMNLAVSFVIFSFYIRDTKRNFPIKVLLLIISLNLYQSAINLFLTIYSFYLFFLYIRNNNRSNFLKNTALVILSYALASALYFVELKVLPMSSRSTLVNFDSSLIYIVLKNNLKAISPFIEFWSYYKWYIIPVIPFSLFGLLIKFRIKYALPLILCFFIFILSILGGLSLLKEGYYPPRVLNYFPFFLIIIFIGLYNLKLNTKYLIILPLFACFLFNYRVGNVMRIQNLFEQPIFYSISVDIHKYKNIRKFYVLGSSPLSNFTKNIIDHTPFNAYLSRLSWNSAFRINEYTSRKIVEEQWGDVHEKKLAEFAKLKSDNQLTLLKDNSPYYCLYKHKDVGYIDWGCNF